MKGDDNDDMAIARTPGPGRVLRHSVFNLLGVIVPACVAIAATPPLIAILGAANFGIFSIQLALLVLLGINDFGLSRAVILVAVDQGGFEAPERRVEVVAAGLTLIGLIALLLLTIGVPITLVGSVIEDPRTADRILSWGLITVSAAVSLPALPLRAGLEVEERFGLVNVLRTLAASSLFLAPLGAVLIEPTLHAAALGLLLSRVFTLALFAAAAGREVAGEFHQSLTGLMKNARERHLPPLQAELVRRGGWLGAAGTASILLSYVDRFALGLIVAAATVTDYVVAAELATKLWLVTGAVIAAATPRLASAWQDRSEVRFHLDLRLTTGAVLAIALLSHCVFLFEGERLMKLWLGPEFRPAMADLLRILSTGIAINSLSIVNSMLLVLAGRERATALIQFVSLPLMAVGAVVAARWAGPVGVAWVFAARLVLDLAWVKFLLAREQNGARAGLSVPLTVGWVTLVLGLYLVA